MRSRTCAAIQRCFGARCSLCLVLFLSLAFTAASAHAVTDIALTTRVLRTGVQRFGINLGGENFYDSGQMLRNLVSRNPGFEGETWQSILRCKVATSHTCTDRNQYAVWPEDFLKGARFEFLSGPAASLTGTVMGSSRAGEAHGVILSFHALARAPAAGDFVLVRAEHPGGAERGWWTNTMASGATFSTELHDLPPDTPGRQALRIDARGAAQSARLDSYFDTYDGRSFLRLHGRYTLSFRAKGLGGSNTMTLSIARTGTRRGNQVLLPPTPVRLTDAWKDYTYDCYAAEDGTLSGHVDLGFAISGASVLLDDVAFSAAAGPNNPTAFRDEVVETLRELQPGILRYTDDGADTAATIDDMIAPQLARRRAGYSTQATSQEDIPLGLHEVLELCRAIHAEPWYSLPATASRQEAGHLIEYLAGAPDTPYGAKRAARGQTAPWTEVFTHIHLEFGNELWNEGTFYGAAMADPAAYGRRAEQLFAAARAAPSYRADKFDLILGSFAANPWWTSEELAHSGHYDTVAVAPYLFNKLVDTSSDEAIFGPMFAEPESMESLPTGAMAQQARAAARANLSIYEVGLGTDAGTASQAMVNAVVPSLGGGLTVIEHMLLMLRDLGITSQAAYSLPGYSNHFDNPQVPGETSPLWGMVVDMGGPTNLRRPLFLAEQLANQAMLPTMLKTQITGANPTWKEAGSRNNDVRIEAAHALETFAFADGARRSMIVFNLNRVEDLPITFSGDGAPAGAVEVSRLTAAHITDNNEQQENVRIVHSTRDGFDGRSPFILPPFSMTVLTWSH